jgi:hypothetical protein
VHYRVARFVVRGALKPVCASHLSPPFARNNARATSRVATPIVSVFVERAASPRGGIQNVLVFEF